jgi:hypothetical protein
VSSSTPFLARFGLEALSTVRVEEDTGAVPCSDHQALPAFGALRAQFQRRAGFAEPPVRTFWQILQTQGAFRDRHGRWVEDAVDAKALLTNGADADGEVVSYPCIPASKSLVFKCFRFRVFSIAVLAMSEQRMNDRSHYYVFGNGLVAFTVS